MAQISDKKRFEIEASLDRLEAALTPATLAEERRTEPYPWEGKPCPVCGKLFERGHGCKPVDYSKDAIPF